jgi:hypothetical protein
VCFIFRYSSNWNLHRLHSEPFSAKKEKHNVGPSVSMTVTTTLVSVLRRFEDLAERSNVLDHYTLNNNFQLFKMTAVFCDFVKCLMTVRHIEDIAIYG